MALLSLSRFISQSISSHLAPLGRYLSTGNHQRISSIDVNVPNRGQFNVLKGGSGVHSLIYIPGALGTASTDYQYQLEYFSRPDSSFNIVAFDPLGYGRNRSQRRQFKTEPIHFLQQDGIDAYHIMQAVEPGKPFSVLGWSDGGVAALFLSALYPSLVNKLVVWGANAFLTKQDIEMFEKTRDIKKWSPGMRDSLQAIYGSDLPQLWSDWLDSMIHIFNKHNGDLCMKELVKIKAPTLILHGDKDPLVPEVHPVYLNDAISDTRVHVFPNGKHNIHIKYSQEFNKIVEEFLLQK
ncbi:PREDICTED: valacyclovir hydrolase-like [Amphimedon queenslandica]|uniref:AB hydrolase-1 domain-containing protein n=1 Tax=Amphimedon queenslandica TaxID=400682 RepID=A0A1X7UKM2_AMPQE|nr:PREDICTED: valacyclovir hydrolase-like [Amphimedon queenslandica]|eukprot:XP_003387533.3 PREDICTED: valacyclovir hydrolase-like [Amphimedon queenslandica]